MNTVSTELAGKTALVTGATSGIGRAAAFRLATMGAEVLVHGRDADRGTQVVEEISLLGGKARFVAADLGTSEGLAAATAAIAEPVDILVNNAGASWFGPSASLSTDDFDALFATNVRSAYALSAHFAPLMAERGEGSIVNIASMAGLIGLAGGAAYGATKLSLVALTRSFAAEFGSRGVRVNAVAPGPVYTAADADRITALGQTTLLGRAARPEEIAQAIGFLASPAASYITGAVIPVDGGRTAV